MAGELSTHEKIQFLSAVSLFPGLDYEQREKIAFVVKSDFYSVDSYICKEGEAGDSMDLIVEGTVRLEVDGLPISTQRGQGECIGEMALIDMGWTPIVVIERPMIGTYRHKDNS